MNDLPERVAALEIRVEGFASMFDARIRKLWETLDVLNADLGRSGNSTDIHAAEQMDADQAAADLAETMAAGDRKQVQP
jgi:hypothetical protein